MGKVIQFPTKEDELQVLVDRTYKKYIAAEPTYNEKSDCEKLLISRMAGFSLAEKGNSEYYLVSMISVPINDKPIDMLLVHTNMVITEEQFTEVIDGTREEIRAKLKAGCSYDEITYAIPYMTEEEILTLCKEFRYIAVFDSALPICDKILDCNETLQLVQLS